MRKNHVIRRKSGVNLPPIRTSLIELIEELSNLTNDDSLVVAAVRSIFDSYRVRLSGSAVPIHLVGAEIPLRAQGRSAWNKGRACA
jgi:hypothetical protein